MSALLPLPDFILPELANKVLDSTGMDSIKYCKDQTYFKNFSLPVTYMYNSRGFRDCEWPIDLCKSIWCLGDSFTVGLGLPFNLTWPQQIKTNLNIDTISVAMDGASNQWIARKACQVLQQIQPKYMIIMWSYFHRRESYDLTMSDMGRRLHYDEVDQTKIDYEEFENCVKSVSNANCNTNIVHMLIPDCHDVVHANSIWNQIRGTDWPDQLPVTLTDLSNFIQHEISNVHRIYDKLEDLCWCNVRFNRLKATTCIIDYDTVDLARDGHHLGVNTSKLLGEQLCRIISASMP